MIPPGDPAPPLVADPVFGLPVDSARLLASGPLLLAFFRHCGSAVTRDGVFGLLERWDELDTARVSVVAVVEGSLAAARDFVPRYHVLFPVVHDEGALYDAWGVPTATLADALGALRPAGVRTILRVGRRAGFTTSAHRAAGYVIAPDGIVSTASAAPDTHAPLDVAALADAALAIARARGGSAAGHPPDRAI